MPLYDYKCLNGHVEISRYVARRDMVAHQVCRTCGKPTRKQFSPGTGRLLFFEQSRARRIVPLDGGTEEFTTYAQFERAQKQAGVAQVSKDDMLHLTAVDSIRKAAQNKPRDPDWIREFMPHV